MATPSGPAHYNIDSRNEFTEQPRAYSRIEN